LDGACGTHGDEKRIILKWILEKRGGGMWIGFIWLRIETGGGILLNTVINIRVA
jgi:hypothetical protein